MATFVEGPVRISVPATSANLGPGFDSLGLALSLRDELEAEVSRTVSQVDVEGAGADGVPRDETHLVVRVDAGSLRPDGRAALPVCGCRATTSIPHARGLGSSSAAIVAGVVLARGLVAGGQLLASDEALFDLAADLEGHPDNVAPAFYGGFVISGREDDHWYAVRAGVDPRISAVVFVPPTGVETRVARGLLPDVGATRRRRCQLRARRSARGRAQRSAGAPPRSHAGLAAPGPARAGDAGDVGPRTSPARRRAYPLWSPVPAPLCWPSAPPTPRAHRPLPRRLGSVTTW